MFDLDGTLVDTLDDITACVNFGLEALEEPSRSREEVRNMVGDGIEALCRRALETPTPARVAKLVDLARTFYQDHPVGTAAPYEGVPEMLDGLRDLHLKLAILSNKPHPMVEAVVARLFSSTPFDVILGQGEGFPPKPDPAGALYVAEILGMPRFDLLHVGDSEVDLQTGIAAGIPFAGVTWGFRSACELQASGGRLLADAPNEILEIAKNLSA
jgi:phosphoglycolate phosphatase